MYTQSEILYCNNYNNIAIGLKSTLTSLTMVDIIYTRKITTLNNQLLLIVSLILCFKFIRCVSHCSYGHAGEM